MKIKYNSNKYGMYIKRISFKNKRDNWVSVGLIKYPKKDNFYQSKDYYNVNWDVLNETKRRRNSPMFTLKSEGLNEFNRIIKMLKTK